MKQSRIELISKSIKRLVETLFVMDVEFFTKLFKDHIDSLSPQELERFHAELMSKQKLSKKEIAEWLGEYINVNILKRKVAVQSPLDILKTRLAKGEIGIKEFNEIKQYL